MCSKGNLISRCWCRQVKNAYVPALETDLFASSFLPHLVFCISNLISRFLLSWLTDAWRSRICVRQACQSSSRRGKPCSLMTFHLDSSCDFDGKRCVLHPQAQRWSSEWLYCFSLTLYTLMEIWQETVWRLTFRLLAKVRYISAELQLWLVLIWALFYAFCSVSIQPHKNRRWRDSEILILFWRSITQRVLDQEWAAPVMALRSQPQDFDWQPKFAVVAVFAEKGWCLCIWCLSPDAKWQLRGEVSM